MSETRIKSRQGVDIFVHRVSAGDAPRLKAFDASLSEATRSFFLPHAYDDETLEQIIARAIAGADRAYLALSGDTVAGYFFLWEFTEPVPVLGVGITDAFQGQGLGAHFMELLIADAREAGRDGIELTTVPGNQRAFALYRKMGFEHIRDANNIAGDGRVVREHVMFLPLKPGAMPPDREFKPPV
jgi:ribosomal protein S18 acetylase RimI-like enzyme